jgi:AcrR family transcriptional regulator
MVRTAPQTEKAEETRRRIVGAAAELFAEHGYAATSLSDVIAAAGSTKGGFYFHFASKADLGLAVAADAREQFAAEVLDATGEHARASDQLVAMVRAIATHAKAKPTASGIGRLCLELREEPQIALADIDPYGGWVHRVWELLERAQREGDLDPTIDPREAALYAIDDHLRLTVRAIALHSSLLDPS